MDRETVVALREEADNWAEQKLQCTGEFHPDFHVVSDERFAALVAAHEREACAKVLDSMSNAPDMQAYAAAIRSRA